MEACKQKLIDAIRSVALNTLALEGPDLSAFDHIDWAKYDENDLRDFKALFLCIPNAVFRQITSNEESLQSDDFTDPVFDKNEQLVSAGIASFHSNNTYPMQYNGTFAGYNFQATIDNDADLVRAMFDKFWGLRQVVKIMIPAWSEQRRTEFIKRKKLHAKAQKLAYCIIAHAAADETLARQSARISEMQPLADKFLKIQVRRNDALFEKKESISAQKNPYYQKVDELIEKGKSCDEACRRIFKEAQMAKLKDDDGNEISKKLFGCKDWTAFQRAYRRARKKSLTDTSPTCP